MVRHILFIKYAIFIVSFTVISLIVRYSCANLNATSNPNTEVTKFISMLPKISKSSCRDAFEIMNQELKYDIKGSVRFDEFVSNTTDENNITYTLLASPLRYNSPPSEFQLSLIILPYKSEQRFDSLVASILGKPTKNRLGIPDTWKIEEIGIITINNSNVIHFQTQPLTYYTPFDSTN